MKGKKNTTKSDNSDIESNSGEIGQISFDDENSDSDAKSDSEKVKETKKPKKKTEKRKASKKTSEKDTNEDEQNVMNSDPDLKENVIAYLQINEIIAEKKEEIKELTKKKLKYEEFLKSYLERESKTKIETDKGDIVFKKQTSKMPLKEDIIEKAIVKKFQDTKKINESGVKIAHDILEEVNSLRGVNIKSNVRYVRKKGKK